MPIPAGAEVVDGTGKFVSPGIIDAHSHIANDAINEGSDRRSARWPAWRTCSIRPTSNIYRDLAGGTTTANILHGSANPIGGKTRRDQAALGQGRGRGLIVRRRAARHQVRARRERQAQARPRRHADPRALSGDAPGRRVRDPRRLHAREGVSESLAGLRGKKKAAGSDVLPPKRDLQLDALVEILEGKRLVHAHSYRADEILMLIRLADEMGFKVTTFQHVLEGYKVAKEIAAHGAGASTFSDWWGYKIEAEDAIPYNAAIMTQKGVARLDQLRRRRAGAPAEHRSRQDRPLRRRRPTTRRSRSSRSTRRSSSRSTTASARSKSARTPTSSIWNHHPLSTAAIVERTYIDGIAYYDRREGPAARRRCRERRKAARRSGRAAADAAAQRRRRRRRAADGRRGRGAATSRLNANGADVGHHQRAHRYR